jgi:flagellar hook-basal body complex protein FliE
MTAKTPIKVIKREERNRLQENSARNHKQDSPRETAREMVSTVTNWVNEFQQKRRTETSAAIKTLFGEPTRPSEA